MSEPQVTVIGVGSPFGADQLGWWVVDGLSQRSELQPFIADGRLRLLSCDRPGSGLIEMLQGSGTVHLIDAMISNAAPGTVRCLRDNFATYSSLLMSSHGFGLGQALAMAEALAELPPDLTLHAVEIPVDLSVSAGLQRTLQTLVISLTVTVISKLSTE